jgi:hypothetical protein
MFKMMVHDTLKVLTPIRWRQQILNARFSSRKPTSGLRVLPHFLVIGAMRAGTSSLFKYLGAHPAIVAALRKEIKYFSTAYHQGETWYRCHFPTRYDLRLLSMVQGQEVQTFEASPDYLMHPQAAARAAQWVPDAKLIVMLRNPIERAFSHYGHMVRLGVETLPFEEAMRQESMRFAAEKERVGEDSFYDSKTFLRHSYQYRGMYAEQLERWFAHFPREQILILSSEAFFAEPDASYAEILAFLGLPFWQPPTFRNYSYLGASQPKARPQSRMSDEMRTELSAMFAPHNRRLFDLLGRDFEWD